MVVDTQKNEEQKKCPIEKWISYLKRQDLKEHIEILILYTLLTFIFTYPVIFKIGTFIPGSGDAFQWMRTLWYTPVAIFNPTLTKLTHDYLIFHPYGIPSLPFQSAFNQVVSYVLSIIVDIDVGYTLLWLFSFIFGAYGTYLLVNNLSNNKYSSFIAGLVFAFSPFHFAHAAGHLGATSIEWIPFCALYLMKMFKEGGGRNSFFAGIFFILVAMSDLQYMMFMGIFVMLLFLYEIYTFSRNEKKNCKESLVRIYYKYSLFGAISLCGLIPLTLGDIIINGANNNFLKLDPFESVTFSTDFLSFFLPPFLHPLFGNVTKGIYHDIYSNTSERTTYIGYIVILLSLFAIRRLKENKYVKFWSIAALLFSLLSLGPLLRVKGNTSFTVFHTSIPLPYLGLYYIIPFLDNCRTTGRFFVIASLSFAVLAGYGISEVLKTINTNKKIVAIVISSLIIFEYLAIPFPVSAVNKPLFYKEISQDKDNYALLEIPATLRYSASGEIIYYQTIHGKPVVGNWAARMPANARNFELNTPVIKELTYLHPYAADILNQDMNQIGVSIFNYYNIPYIILHKNYMNDTQVNFAETFIQKTLNTERKMYENDSLIVYHVKKEVIKPFMILKDNWYDTEEWNGVPTRWIASNANLLVYSGENHHVRLLFNATSFDHARNLSIISENSSISTIKVPTDLKSRTFSFETPVKLHKGENLISFQVMDGSDRPCDIPTLNFPDPRNLGVAIQNITLVNFSAS